MFKALLSLIANSFSRKIVSIYTSTSIPQTPSLMSTVKNNSIEYYSGDVLNLYKQVLEPEKHIKAERKCLFPRSSGDNLSSKFLEYLFWEIYMGCHIPGLG